MGVWRGGGGVDVRTVDVWMCVCGGVGCGCIDAVRCTN